MSGTIWLTLAETDGGIGRALPDGTDLPSLHTAMVAEITRSLGPAHAALFARPVAAGPKVTWQAEGQDARRLADLPAESRRALLAAIGSILSDIRRLVEAGQAPILGRLWPGVRLIPGLGSVFAVDGRPVLMQWGHAGTEAGADPLAVYDDGIRLAMPVPVNWRPYAAALGAVAGLALLAVLLLPQFARWAVAEPMMCRLDPVQLDLMRQQAAAEARGNALRAVLAATNDDIGRKQLQCPIPVVQAPAPSPARLPPPAPRAELPSDAWDRHDLTMLEGCWHSSTQMRTQNQETGQVRAVAEWRLCFDHGGHGRQTIRWADQGICTGPEDASFHPDNSLLLADASRCTGPVGDLMRGTFECKRISDTEATCTRMDVEGPARGRPQTGRFSR